MLRIWLLVLPWLIGFPSFAAANPPSILVLGDSLSAAYGLAQNAGWVALLQQRLAQEGYAHRVVNSSVSGDTTISALSRLPQELVRHQPAIVIVELGGNDGLRGLPLADLRANLQAIITAARAANAEVLLVGMRLPPNYGPVYVNAFADSFRDVAQLTETPLVPFLLAGIENDYAAFQSDGIHPNAASQPRMLDNVWPVLRPLLEKTRGR